MPDIFNLSDTWNSGVTVFYGIKMNVGDTAHANGSRLFELQTNGVTQFAVDPQNGVVVGAPVSGPMGPGSINVQALYINGVALAGNFQPLDADLTSIAAASLTGKMYYRKANGDWQPVNVSTGLNFDPSTGDLIATAIPGMGNVISSGTPVNGQLALWLTSNAIKGIDIGSGLSLVGGTTLTATGAVAITGTPVNGQIAQWTDGTHIQGVPISSITTAVTIGDAAPASPTVGQLWWESDTGGLFLRYQDADSTQWVAVNGQAQVVSSTGIPEAPIDGTIYGRKDAGWVAAGGGGASISIADTPPASPTAGAMWWESDTGILWIYYNDGTSSQWVAISAAATVPSQGGLVLLAAKQASNSATIDFTGLDGKYDGYEVHYFDVLPGVINETMAVRVSQGGVFQTAATYYYGINTAGSNAANSPNGASNTGAINVTHPSNLGSTAAYAVSGRVKIARPASNGPFKPVTYEATHFSQAGFYLATTGGGAFCGNGNPVDGLRFFMGASNIVQGTFKLYGVV